MSDLQPPFWTRAVYAYKSDYEDDLNFEVGQLVQIIAIEDDEWFSGQYTDSKGVVQKGLFPKNFVSGVAEPGQSESLPKQHEQADASAEQESPVAIESSESQPAQQHHQSRQPLSSKVPTFAAESSIPLPTAKVAEKSTVKKSYQGVPSSYVPPSFSKKETTAKKEILHHSSYVPPVLGLNRAKTQEKNDAPASHPVTSFHDETDADEGPKLSLKERIALLQKQQQEEAERQAAALKKKTERATEKAEKTELTRRASLISNSTGVASIAGTIDGADIDATDVGDDLVPASLEGDSHEALEMPTQEEGDEEAEKEEEEGNEEGNEEGPLEEEDEEEEEDTEESRRAALRDRMARLAGPGAGGMYGGGFNPFATGPSGGIPKGPPAKRHTAARSEAEEVNLPSAPIPVMSFGGAAPEIPKALQKDTEKQDEPEVETEAKDGSDNSESTEYQEADHEKFQPVDPTISEPRSEVPDAEHDPIPPIPTSHKPDENTEVLTGSLADRLTGLDIVEPGKQLSESAVEGDDEREKDTSDDDFVQHDSLLEKSEATMPAPRLGVSSGFDSEYTTGYESDDDVLKADESVLPHAPPVPSGIPISAIPPAPILPFLPQRTPSKAAPVPPPPPPHPTGAVPPHATKLPPPPPVPYARDYETPTRPTVDTSSRFTGETVSPLQSPTVPFHPPQPDRPAGPAPAGIPPVPAPPRNTALVSSPNTAAPSPPSAGLRKASTFSDGQQEKRGSISSRTTIPVGDNLDLASQWWLKGKELPPLLQSRAGKDLIFEVDEHKVNKRGGKQLVLRDYYILHQDNSQTIINVSFEAQDPQGTVQVSQKEELSPILTKKILHAYSQSIGVTVFRIATHLLNSTVNGPLIPHILSQIPGVLPPVGLRSYGATIYSNNNNTEVHQLDDFKPGDVLAINKARFHGHNKLRQKIVYDVGSGGSPFAAVITEYDEEKRKFRVVELDPNGKCRHSSYKPSDMKSGKIKVFRVVGRDFVLW